MHFEDGFASFYIRTIQRHAAVKATGAQKCRVKNIGAVGCGDDNDIRIGIETVHFDQHLIQGLLAFIVRTAETCSALTTYGINFIHENDTGRMSLGLIEQIAHAARAHAHEHFNEFRTGNGEEGHARFTRDSLCQAGSCLFREVQPIKHPSEYARQVE